ncbi:hypothetical protein [Roseomonas sp. WA12]
MIPAFRPMPSASYNMTAGSVATQTDPAPTGAHVVRVVPIDGPVRVHVGATNAASATTAYVPQGVVEYFLCTGGEKLSAIRAGASDVSVSVAFCTR